MVIKLMAHVLTSSVRLKKLYFLSKLILCFILEFFELFKGFRLMFHQIDISIPTQIISEGNEVLITPLAVVLIGPHTSLCTSPNKSDALSQLFAKGVLVILPSRQDSHVLNDSKSNEVRIPSSWSFFMRFQLIWPSR